MLIDTEITLIPQNLQYILKQATEQVVKIVGI